MAEVTSKPRLRLTSQGWFFYWTSYIHSLFGQVEVWVGPYPTIEAAYRAATLPLTLGSFLNRPYREHIK